MKLGILVTKNNLVFAFVGLIQSLQSMKILLEWSMLKRLMQHQLAVLLKIVRCSLPISQCSGQGYDGCSVMMGYLTGVATQLRQIEPTALQVHCFAHSLNLCLQDAAKLCVIVRDCLGLVYEMLQLIKYSPKHYLVFEKCQKEFSPELPGLRPLCPTR